MRGIASRRSPLELAWFAFALANVGAMILWPEWETIPFHLIWFTLTVLYGFRVWALRPTFVVLGIQGLVTGILISFDVQNGSQEFGELFEVPLMSAMFLAMVWHARRHRDATVALEANAHERAALLARQERFLQDASHELRTPITIARGHLELMHLGNEHEQPEVAVALDELGRMGRIVERLLLLARAGRTDFTDVAEDVDLEALIEDLVLRWSEVARRAWQVGDLAAGTLRTNRDALRIALDALVENAVAHTSEDDAIMLSTRGLGDSVAIEVADEGGGIPREMLDRIFERFGRADPGRARSNGGVDLGLSIVDAIAKAHGGRCTVRSSRKGSTFTLVLPSFQPARSTLAATLPGASA